MLYRFLKGVDSYQDHLGNILKTCVSRPLLSFMNHDTLVMMEKEACTFKKVNTCNVFGGKSLNCNVTSLGVALGYIPGNKGFLWLNV